MGNTGSFKKVGNDFQGEIVTLSLKTKGVRIVAETNRSNDNAPSHRIYVGRAEKGAAWSKPPKSAATTSRSSSTILPSTHRSTRTCSTTKAVKAIPYSGRGRAKMVSDTRSNPARDLGRGFLSEGRPVFGCGAHSEGRCPTT